MLIKILTLLDRRIRLKFSHVSLKVSFLKMTDNTSFVAFCRQQVTKILPTQNQKFLQTLRRDHELYRLSHQRYATHKGHTVHQGDKYGTTY